MKAWVLGSGTGVPSARRGAAGYVVVAGGRTMLFDCGMGTMARLLRVGIDFLSIDDLFLSHHHADHCADTVALLWALTLDAERRAGRPLTIIGPTGTSRFMQRLYDTFPSLQPTDYEVPVEEHMLGVVHTSAGRVYVHPVKHGDIAAVGFQVETDEGRWVYTGDTTECEEVVRLARGADIFVSECSYPDGHGNRWHLTPSQVGRLATQAGVKRVILSHMYPSCEQVDVAAQCAATYAGPITVAEDCTPL